MRFSPIGIIAVLLILIAVALAGCSGSSPSAQSGAGTQAAGTQAAGSSGSSAGPVSGTSLFGGLNYNWIEYKMSSGSGSQAMTMYIKYEKGGKCTMRFDPAPQGMPATMDCTSTGSKAVSNPNDISSSNPDVKFTDIGPDVVTVPAGTYTAEKYTATMNGATSTYWVVKGTGMVKMVGGNTQGSMTMELNGIG